MLIIRVSKSKKNRDKKSIFFEYIYLNEYYVDFNTNEVCPDMTIMSKKFFDKKMSGHVSDTKIIFENVLTKNINGR